MLHHPLVLNCRHFQVSFHLKQLARQAELFPRRKAAVEAGGLILVDEIGARSVIYAAHPVEIARLEFGEQEIGRGLRPVAAYAVFARRREARAAVKLRIALDAERSGAQRLCLVHRNIPAILANVTLQLSNDGVNVENMTNKSKGDYAYTLVDVNTRITDEVASELRAIPNMIRVRVLNH